ncbi:MAG: hypothetical protein AAGE13_10455 [Pseudomonadota bacterium]
MPQASRLLALALLLPLIGCGNDIQTTSGTRYVAAYTQPVPTPDHRAKPGIPLSIDQEVVKAASVDPQLQIPGRFGLARIVNGRLTAIPEEEAEQWRGLVAKHTNLGEFVAISPLVAALAAGDACRPYCDPIREIRLGAARQHVDAVLVYELGARTEKTNTLLAVADLTIIGGAFLPTRTVSAEGVAQALLLDVRNGYPYGTASALADLSELSPSFGSEAVRARLLEDAMLLTVERLMPEVDAMIGKLIAAQLAAR